MMLLEEWYSWILIYWIDWECEVVVWEVMIIVWIVKFNNGVSWLLGELCFWWCGYFVCLGVLVVRI